MEKIRFKLLELKFWFYWKARKLISTAERIISSCAAQPHLTIAELFFAAFITTVILTALYRNSSFLSTGIFLLVGCLLNLLYSYRNKKITGKLG